VDRIISLFPNNTELRVARKSFETFKTMNVSIIIKVWYQQVYVPYSQQIMLGDLTYFLEKDYQDDLSALSNVSEIMHTIDSFRHKIRDMNSEDKDVMLNYLQKLTILSNQYSA
jgi:hypothetical protein